MTTTSVRAFRASDFTRIQACPEQGDFDVDFGTIYEQLGNAYTLEQDGEILACGGIVVDEHNMGHVWSVLARDAPLLTITRAAERFLSCYEGGLFATHEEGFGPGGRWLELLGFVRFDVWYGYGPNGSNHIAYVREGRA